MNYLEARIELLKPKPRIPFNLLAVEIATLVAIAAILVKIFA